MQQIKSPSIENLPKIGYYTSKEQKKEEFYKNEPHIYKQGPLSGVKAGAHKLYNDFLTYFPKGFAGSKNSDFYEYLSLGMVPYIVGSATLIALYSAANRKFLDSDASCARSAAKCFGAGVVLYGIGKWASQKLSRTLIHASTGVDLNMRYINKKQELPEPGQEKGIVRVQYPGVFDSVNFFRKDLLSKDSELNHGDINAYNDKIAKKAGFKDKLNCPAQTMDDKIRELKARSCALENVNKYILAALGVAFGVQKGFSGLTFRRPLESLKNAFKDSAKQLWKGNDRNLVTKHYGKALIFASIASTLSSWLIPTIAFKHNPNKMTSKVDTKKEYEVA